MSAPRPSPIKRSQMVVAVIAMSAAFVCPARAADWSQFGGNAGHTRSQPREELIGPHTVLRLERAWSADLRAPGLENSFASGPAIADGRVFAAQWGVWDPDARIARSQVVALKLTTGEELWRVDVPGTVHWTPAVSNDTVIVGLRAPGTSMMLVGLRTSDGAERWSTVVGCSGCPAGQVDVQPLVAADGVVIAALGDDHRGGGRDRYGYVRAYDAATGDEIWGREVPAPGMPVIADGALVVSHESRRVNRADTIWALELGSGARRWRRSEGVGTYVEMSAAGHSIFATTGRHLLALSTEDGSTRWSRRIHPVLAPVTVGTRTVLHVDRSEALQALDRSTGEERWRLTARRFDNSDLASTWIAGRVVFVPAYSFVGDRSAPEGGREPGTFAVRVVTGRVIGLVPLRGVVRSEFVAVADGFLVHAHDPARLVAYTVPTER